MTMMDMGYVHRLVNGVLTKAAGPGNMSLADYCHQHFIVITVVLRNKNTNIRIEINAVEGALRATSILCLLGFGLGLSSVLLYRLYTRFISPIGRGSHGRRKRATSPSCEDQRYSKQFCSDQHARLPSDAECSSSECDVMGNRPTTASPTPTHDPSVAYSTTEGLHFRGIPYGSVAQESCGDYTRNYYHNDTCNCDVANANVHANGLSCKRLSRSSSKRVGRTPELSPSSVGSDYGFVSGENFAWSPCGGPDVEWGDDGSPGTYSLLTNFSPSSVNERNLRVADELANFDQVYCNRVSCDNAKCVADCEQCTHSSLDTSPMYDLETREVGGVNSSNRFLRRQRYSLPSEMGSTFIIDDDVFIGCMYQGHSIDLGENLSGIMTPGSDIMGNEDAGEKTANNMDMIQNELKRLNQEIESMNNEMTVLNSRDNVSVVNTMAMVVIDASELATQAYQRNVHRHHATKRRRSSLSGIFSDDSTAENDSSHLRDNDYMWDYQSDLAGAGVYGDAFLAQRPVASGFYIGSRPQSPISDTEKHLFDITNSPSEFDGSGSCGKRAPPVSDLYIDDDISTIACLISSYNYNSPLSQTNVGDTTYSKNMRNVQDKYTDVSFDKTSDVSQADVFYTPSGGHCKTDSPPVTGSSTMRSCDKPDQVGPSKKTAIVSPSSTKKSSRVDVTPPVFTPVSPTSEQISWQVDNVSAKLNMFEYAEREWGGNTERARTIRKAYHQIPSLFGLSDLCVVRGDNYCALRSVLYQALVNNLLAYRGIVRLDSVLQRLDSVFEDHRYGYLHGWHFANRLPYSKDKVKDTLKDCLRCLCEQIERVSQLSRYEDRARYLHLLLNHNPQVDLQLLEAVKVLMMLNAVSLHEDNQCGVRVPVFVWLLYARESSCSPEMLFRNHIDRIGDTSGVEQVEMFLLGYTLGVKVEVARPSQYGKDDFVSHYPDDGADTFPKVYLVAEGSSNYNIVVK